MISSRGFVDRLPSAKSDDPQNHTKSHERARFLQPRDEYRWSLFTGKVVSVSPMRLSEKSTLKTARGETIHQEQIEELSHGVNRGGRGARLNTEYSIARSSGSNVYYDHTQSLHDTLKSAPSTIRAAT